MAADPVPLASLSLTHVYYDPSDPLSLLCAYLALFPQALCVVYATLLWSSREAEVALLFAGQLACEAANLALKRLIREERPRSPAHDLLVGRGYGMPSSHAQFTAFWAAGLGLFLMLRHRPRPRGGAAERRKKEGGAGGAAGVGDGVEAYAHAPWAPAERALVSLAAAALAAAVAWSRVYLGYHSGRQVAVGSGAGVACALAWFAVTAAARRAGLVAWALELAPARWLRIRDLVVEEDLPTAGWEKWEGRRAVGRAAKGK